MSEQSILSQPVPQAEVEYRSISGFPGYRVGDDGSVWSCLRKNGRHPATIGDTWKRIRQNVVRGYAQVALYAPGVRIERKVHHLVLEAFVGPAPEGMEACHRNGDRLDNRSSNLRWGTKQDNCRDRRRHGNDTIGERNGRATLTNEEARAIRDELRSNKSLRAVAQSRGISIQMAERLKYGWQWKCLGD